MTKKIFSFVLFIGILVSFSFDSAPCRKVKPLSYRYYDLKGDVKEIYEFVFDVVDSSKSIDSILSQKSIAQSVVYFDEEGNVLKINQLNAEGKVLSVQKFLFKAGCLQREEMYNAKGNLSYSVIVKEGDFEKAYRLEYFDKNGKIYTYYDVKLNDADQMVELVRSDTSGVVLSTLKKTYDNNGRLLLEKDWLGDYYSEMKVEYLRSDARGNWIDRYHITNNAQRKLLLHRKIIYY